MHESHTRLCPLKNHLPAGRNSGLDALSHNLISPPTPRGTSEESLCEQAEFFYWGPSSYCCPDSPQPFGRVQGFVAGHAQHTAALSLCGACVGRTCVNPLRWLQHEVQHPTMSKYDKKGYLHVGVLKVNRLYWGAGTKQRPPRWRHAWIHIVITVIFSAFFFTSPLVKWPWKKPSWRCMYCIFSLEFGCPLQLPLTV